MPSAHAAGWGDSWRTSSPQGEVIPWAPLYPVARKASPASVTGSEPSPALVVAVPSLLAAPQLHSTPAGGSGQGVTFFRVAAMPGGRVTGTPLICWSASGRLRVSAKFV